MKTLVKIEIDYNSTLSFDSWKEYVNELANDNNFFVEVENRNFFNPIENNCKKGVNSVTFDARGYSQSDWQTYIVYWDKDENNALELLIDYLKKSFTHKHDYFVTKHEYTEIDGKMFINDEFYDCTSFFISDTESPNENDVIQMYNSIYGIDYNKIEVTI